MGRGRVLIGRGRRKQSSVRCAHGDKVCSLVEIKKAANEYQPWMFKDVVDVCCLSLVTLDIFTVE